MSYTTSMEERPEELMASALDALEQAVPMLNESLEGLQRLKPTLKRAEFITTLFGVAVGIYVGWMIVDMIREPTKTNVTIVAWNIVVLIYVFMLRFDIVSKRRLTDLLLASATNAVSSSYVMAAGSKFMVDLKKQIAAIGK